MESWMLLFAVIIKLIEQEAKILGAEYYVWSIEALTRAGIIAYSDALVLLLLKPEILLLDEEDTKWGLNITSMWRSMSALLS